MIKEIHSLDPFVFEDTKVLMLGSFPPKREKWSMDFYYPNFQNDMWRIMGLVFFENKGYFLVKGERSFDKSRICEFLKNHCIGIGDAAYEVLRLKDNASDLHLQVVQSLDFEKLLDTFHQCHFLLTTGGKSGEIVQNYFDLKKIPNIGKSYSFEWKGRMLTWYRVPSSSRAYPLSIVEKTKVYASVFRGMGILS